MRALQLAVVLAITAVVFFAAGAFYGKHEAEEKARAQWTDREISLKGIELHKDLTTLLALRQEPQQKLAPDLELWITERIKGLDLETVAPGSASSAVLRETANKLVEYRTKYPGTGIDPGKDAKVRRLLTFAGQPILPSNNALDSDTSSAPLRAPDNARQRER
jgi:hypothetical protein